MEKFSNNLKHSFLVIFVALFAFAPGFAQADPESEADASWAVSILAQSVSTDGGLGVGVQTPAFLPWNSVLRLTYSQLAVEAVPANETVFSDINYGLAELSWISYFAPANPDRAARGYWGLGIGAVLPNDQLTDESTSMPAEIIFGIEVGPAEGTDSSSSFSAYLETGYVFNNQVAEILDGEPGFAGGLKLGGGVRYYF